MYQKIIREYLERLGRTDIAPRLVEASMRLQYGTLDHLDRRTFERETHLAVELVDLGREQIERLADSYGLVDEVRL